MANTTRKLMRKRKPPQQATAAVESPVACPVEDKTEGKRRSIFKKFEWSRSRSRSMTRRSSGMPEEEVRPPMPARLTTAAPDVEMDADVLAASGPARVSAAGAQAASASEVSDAHVIENLGVPATLSGPPEMEISHAPNTTNALADAEAPLPALWKLRGKKGSGGKLDNVTFSPSTKGSDAGASGERKKAWGWRRFFKR